MLSCGAKSIPKAGVVNRAFPRKIARRPSNTAGASAGTSTVFAGDPWLQGAEIAIRSIL